MSLFPTFLPQELYIRYMRMIFSEIRAPHRPSVDMKLCTLQDE